MFILIWTTLLFTVTDIGSSSDQSKPKITGETAVMEGHSLNLTCSSDNSPPSFITWTKHGFNTTMTNGTGAATLIISNMTAERSGRYICSAEHLNNTLTEEVDVKLKSSDAKKPEIYGKTILIEGGTLNLTCTADSFPQSAITWTKHGINKTLNNEAFPDMGTSSLFIQNVTVEDSGQYVCTVKHLNALTQVINITVINERKVKISGETAVMEGRSLNLTCSFNSSPPSFITWTKRGFNTTMTNGTGAATLIISNMTAERSGRYICSAEHLNNTLTEEVDVKLKYVKKPKITGNTTVKEGETLNLTCTVDSFPPSVIMWTKHGINKTEPDSGTSNFVLHNVTVEDSGQYFCTANNLNTLTRDVNISVIYQRSLKVTGEAAVAEGQVLQLTCSVDCWPPAFITWTKLGFNTTLKNGTGTASLVVYNVTAEHSGQYICTAKHLDSTRTKEVNIKVKRLPQILEESGCEAQLGVLTCVCVSQGFPLPTIKWLLLENRTEYSFNTAVSNHTVKNTLLLTAPDHGWDQAVCVSRNENGETKRNLIIKNVEEEGRITKLFRTVTKLGTMIPFLIGVLLSALIFCLLMLCCRKKQKAKGREAETLEMVMSQESSLTNGGQVMEYEQIQAQGTSGGADGDETERSDVEYSDIKLLMLKQKISTGRKWKKEENTEYSKIKLKEAKPQTNEEDKEEEKLKPRAQEVHKDEDVAVYSNVTELMDHS